MCRVVPLSNFAFMGRAVKPVRQMWLQKGKKWENLSLAFRSEFWLCPSRSVCFAVWKNRHMRTVTNYFIVNLSFADVLVTIICLPASLVVDITETWFFGNMLCKIVPYLQVCDLCHTQSLTQSSVDWRIHAFTFFYCSISTSNRWKYILHSLWSQLMRCTVCQICHPCAI